jgi:TetR/AcrR family transcriptional repressor of nem operon
MAYSNEHKATTRRRILEAANRLFAANGYEGTTIEQIMSDCGLTRGGFYAHFSSKGQLYRHALTQGPSIDAAIRQYLDAPEAQNSTLMPDFSFLAIDVACKSPAVRAAYTDAFVYITRRLLSHSRAGGSADENSGLSAAALMVGALAVAHTTDDADLKAKLLASCRENTGALLGGAERSPPSFFWEPTTSTARFCPSASPVGTLLRGTAQLSGC